MPFCPKCRDEFEDWVKICPDCGLELVDTRPEKPPRQKKVISSEPLVTVATFSYPLEAHLSRAKLESEGIEGFVADEHMVIANWLYSIAIGGVKLWVKKSDAEKAAEILRGIPARIPEKVTESTESVDEERCPKCNSIDIRYETFHIRALFVLWLLFAIIGSSFTLPLLKRKWKCNSCGYEWKMAKLHGKESLE